MATNSSLMKTNALLRIEKPITKTSAACATVQARRVVEKTIRKIEPSVGDRPKTVGRRSGGRRKSRRQQHGSAWYWKQTDCWYYALPVTKKRMPLFDEEGLRIRGMENKQAARLALARVRLVGEWSLDAAPPVPAEEWLVAKVCSEYLQSCERGVNNGSRSQGHLEVSNWILNALCKFCGALPVSQLKKGHIRTWMDGRTTWKSPATHRCAIGVILAAFNYAQENHDIPNPLKGLKKPLAQARLHSLCKEDEAAMYAATDGPFRDFLFAAFHTGLRLYCELAKMTADDVEDAPRGVMWRV